MGETTKMVLTLNIMASHIDCLSYIFYSMFMTEKIHITLAGPAAEFISNEADINHTTPLHVISRALGIYSKIADSASSGETVVFEKTFPNGEIERHELVLEPFPGVPEPIVDLGKPHLRLLKPEGDE